MKRLLLLIILLVVVAIAQTGIHYVPIWINGHYTWPQLGKSFVIQNGILEILLPPQRTRVYGIVLTRDPSTGNYPLPTGISNIVVWHNGLRNTLSLDYTIETTGLKMLYAAPDALIVIDYDREN